MPVAEPYTLDELREFQAPQKPLGPVEGRSFNLEQLGAFQSAERSLEVDPPDALLQSLAAGGPEPTKAPPLPPPEIIPPKKEFAESLRNLRERSRQEAAAKAKVAAEPKAAALKATVQAEAQAKAATEAKTAADKAAADATAKAKQATDVQAAVAKAVEAATKAAAPKDINVAVASQIVTLKVTPAPITLNQTPPGTVQQGSKLELPVSITRLYGYADPVQLKITVPADAKGLKVAAATIAKDATDVKLAIEVAADAAPGTFTLSVQATSKFNGQDLSVAGNVVVTVQKTEPAEAAE